MIPTDPEHDDLNTARGIIWGLILCVLLWILVLMTIWLLTRTPAGAERESSLVGRIERLQTDMEAAEYLRAEAARKAAEYRAIGAVVARYNPALSVAEQYLIGRAVTRWSAEYGLDERLVLAVIVVESSGDYRAVSPKGAVGLMQVMPWWPSALGAEGDLRDIDFNVRVGAFILADNIRRWGGEEGVARYFWGASRPDGTYVAKVRRAKEAIGG